MSAGPIFVQDRCLVVTARGPGKLHMLTYQSNGGLGNVLGAVTTTNPGVTRFMLFFSYTYEKYAFYWDGAGEGVHSLGTDLQRQPVGTSWAAASLVTWGASTVTTANVASIASAVKTETTAPTCFTIPDKI